MSGCSRSVPVESTYSGGELFAKVSYDQAFDQAKQSGKLVMIDFMADWCGPCRQLDRTTWKNDEVIAAVHENAVPIKLNVDHNNALASKHGVRVLPTIVFLDADGNEVRRFKGYKDAGEFMYELRQATGS